MYLSMKQLSSKYTCRRNKCRQNVPADEISADKMYLSKKWVVDKMYLSTKRTCWRSQLSTKWCRLYECRRNEPDPFRMIISYKNVSNKIIFKLLRSSSIRELRHLTQVCFLYIVFYSTVMELNPMHKMLFLTLMQKFLF